MMPTPSELNYFVEVASTLNISRAAERLGISQPTLSLAIRRLEDAISTPLLIRGKSGVALTRAGQKFLSQARHLLSEWEKLTSEAIRAESHLTGRYILGCHPSVALYTLPHFLPKLLHTYPDVEIKLMHGLSRQVTDDVIGFKVDFGLVVNPVKHPDLVIKILARDEVTLWSSPRGKAQAEAEAGEGVLICDPDLVQTQSVLKQLASRGMPFRRTITTGNLEVVASLTAASAGLGILPGRVATRESHWGLKPLVNAPRFQDRICLIYRADAHKSAASRLLIKAMADCLSD